MVASPFCGYELVGPKLGLLVAIVLPWLELLVGVCLLAGVFVGGALLVSVAMGAMFAFVICSALWRHLDISCGCFNAAVSGKISYLTLIRALVITALSAAAYAATILFAPRQRLRPAPASPQPAGRAPAVGGAMTFAVLGLVAAGLPVGCWPYPGGVGWDRFWGRRDSSLLQPC